MAEVAIPADENDDSDENFQWNMLEKLKEEVY